MEKAPKFMHGSPMSAPLGYFNGIAYKPIVCNYSWETIIFNIQKSKSNQKSGATFYIYQFTSLALAYHSCSNLCLLIANYE